MSRKINLILATVAILGVAAPTVAQASDPVAGCTPRVGYNTQLLEIVDAFNLTYGALLNPPTETEWLAIVAGEDKNGDGWVCAGVHDHLNPHFAAHRLFVRDNFNKGKLP